MQVLKLGSSGEFVAQWQSYLRGQGHLLNVTGVFDEATRLATIKFQTRYKLGADGTVGNQTLGKAAMLGFELVKFAETELSFPAKPNFPPLAGNDARQKLFGPLAFVAAPTAKNPEAIKITNGWDKQNIVKVVIPQLVGVEGANVDGHVWFHKKAAPQLILLWQRWQEAGVLKQVLTYSGDYVPRFVRGQAHAQTLSNHAFGTAFDINYAWNKLGAEPATAQAKGCVYALVRIANDCGFYWGGHFARKDGMHFEVAKILP